ncbi:MAG: phosphoribosylformylglycinamidine cyclo-ligase [Bdellovibrionales bacterium]|nr:phosphoribosylformylglycinamidine cyclo-ligase [Bdellovibrionales bacterium]
MDYKAAGVDVEKGDLFVEKIKKLVGSTYNDKVVSGVGGFSALYKIADDRVLSAATDGVGTKLLLAIETKNYSGIGQDLVAMCVNDILCSGAYPLFFLDYYATGKLDLEVSVQVLESIVAACLESEIALIGGETAEMPGLYSENDLDLAGFAIGDAKTTDIFTGENISEGDVVLGLASSGFHSNGYSLLRKTPGLTMEEKNLLLEPTKLYVKVVKALRESYKSDIVGLSHITGGGFENLPRWSDAFDVIIDNGPCFEELPRIMQTCLHRLELKPDDAYSTFNMGIGLAILCKKQRAEEVVSFLQRRGEKVWKLGHVIKGNGKLVRNFSCQ